MDWTVHLFSPQKKLCPREFPETQPVLCAVTEPLIQFYFSSVRVFKFTVGVFKITQGYSNR